MALKVKAVERKIKLTKDENDPDVYLSPRLFPSYEKLGRALSNQQFDFESDCKTSGHIYKLVEK